MLLWKNGRIFTGNISFIFPENFSVLYMEDNAISPSMTLRSGDGLYLLYINFVNDVKNTQLEVKEWIGSFPTCLTEYEGDFTINGFHGYQAAVTAIRQNYTKAFLALGECGTAIELLISAEKGSSALSAPEIFRLLDVRLSNE